MMREHGGKRKLEMINLDLPVGSEGLLKLRIKAVEDYL